MEPITARRLLGCERERAFEDGCAPLLAEALVGQVTNVLAADRAGYYLNLLYALLLMRRSHELEPRHADLYARVLGPQRLLGASDGRHYEPEEFAQDLEQLLDWGAVQRITEAERLRGYRDNRRVRFRYRLTQDAIALLEWLEARLAAKLEGRVRDSSDRLADVIGLLKEAKRVLDAWRRTDGDSPPETARRAYYLLEAAADAVSEISDELLGFRAEMVAFANRPYDIAVLREILEWLERYVLIYLGRIEELRTEVRDRLRVLSAPRYRRALDECREVVETDRARPRMLRQAGPLRDPAELIATADRFFRHGGQLAELCRHIDDSARAVLVKMHRHIKELERRNARLDDLRATIAAAARLPARTDLTGFVNALIGSAHALHDRRPGFPDHRVAPPSPRRHAPDPARRSQARPLARKRSTPEDARALRAKRLAELAEWIRAQILTGERQVRLSEIPEWDAGAPRRWLDVARARHLGGAQSLRRLGASFRDVDGVATVGDENEGLEAPDCIVEPTFEEQT